MDGAAPPGRRVLDGGRGSAERRGAGRGGIAEECRPGGDAAACRNYREPGTAGGEDRRRLTGRRRSPRVGDRSEEGVSDGPVPIARGWMGTDRNVMRRGVGRPVSQSEPRLVPS